MVRAGRRLPPVRARRGLELLGEQREVPLSYADRVEFDKGVRVLDTWNVYAKHNPLLDPAPRVLMCQGESAPFIHLTPAEARQIAANLIANADEIDRSTEDRA